MDASQYKDYVLTLLFVKYVTDKGKSDRNSLIDVPVGGSFDDLVSFKGDKEIGDKINKAISKLAEANDLQKVIDLADFNDEEKLGKGKEMQDRLTNLISIFQDIDFRGSRAEGDDLLGDAYEYLMRHFATESGKSKGQFYTPAEVSRSMAQLIGIEPSTPYSATVYDPTCGSGSLLLKVADAAPNGLTIYGQEKDNATWALAKMNMILHSNEIADIRKGDTIASPQFTTNDRLDTFDFLVANPPFSVKSWANGLENEYGRFDGYGRPPEKNGDFAFLLHMLKSLKSTGKGAVILPHGVLFRGNSEAVIRKEIIKRGYIKGIIGLPANLFYGTGIPACILILDKENAQARTGIFMIDASKGFEKDGPKNRLRAQDIHKIVDTFTRQTEVPRYARMVSVAEISDPKNDYNLNLPRYIDSTEPEDIQDIAGHLRGGIPERDIEALDRYWQIMPNLRATLFKKSPHPGYCELISSEVNPTIFGHPEFTAFKADVDRLFAKWKVANAPRLKGFAADAVSSHPKALIEVLSEDLLTAFALAPLVDHYDIYQHLMDYWAETMQDDCYLITADGWVDATKPRLMVEDKNKKTKEKPHLIVGKKKYKTELIPAALVIARYFAKEQAVIEKLETDIAALQQQMEELAEEHSGEGGSLEDAKNDKNKITKASVAARLKDIKGDKDADDERKVLTDYLALSGAEATANTALKAAQESLMEKVFQQYAELTEDDTKTLVVDDKWLATLAAAVHGELDRVSRTLTGRIGQLSERYATPLPQLTDEVATLSSRVDKHLKKMGVVWT
jgi:type I restriction enzyme M protein